jgi:hypothetical protein
VDGVSRWIRNVQSIVKDDCERLKTPFDAAPLDTLLQEALAFEGLAVDQAVGSEAFRQLWQAQRSHVPKVIRAIERLTSVKKTAAGQQGEGGGGGGDMPTNPRTHHREVLALKRDAFKGGAPTDKKRKVATRVLQAQGGGGGGRGNEENDEEEGAAVKPEL